MTEKRYSIKVTEDAYFALMRVKVQMRLKTLSDTIMLVVRDFDYV